MANIKRIEGKKGVSYKITVMTGRDSSGKQLRHYLTWIPEPGMTARQIDKAVQKAAVEFEQSILQGYQLDNRQTFARYAEYVIELKQQQGCKTKTLELYERLLDRINQSIGHMKLTDIRPQHLNNLYRELGRPGVARTRGAVATAALHEALKGQKHTEITEKAGIGHSTFEAAVSGTRVSLRSAEAISKALGRKVEALFAADTTRDRLSGKTILEYHRLIHTIFAQAEKEMLVPYNPASKATPPKADTPEADYLQPETVARIMEALEQEPLRWRVLVHLLIVTGCRRGEIVGLKWDKVDFDNKKLLIDTALLYSPKKGLYESTTKTGQARFVSLPGETVTLLREYRRDYLALRLKNGDRWQDTGFLFVRDDGQPIVPDTVTGWLAKFSDRHGLPHIHPHTFRHTSASLLIAAGQDIVSVSKRLGHAKVSTTTDIYAHMLREADVQAADCIADAILRKKA